jgi:conjugative transfer signal peptidase TraF
VSSPALLGVVVGIGLTLFSKGAGEHPVLIWNASPSQPVGLYRAERLRARLGERVLVRLPPRTAAFAARRGYLARGAYLLKAIAAVAGDRVCRWGAQISVRGQRAGRAKWRDHLGRDLPVWHGCQRLKAGELFLLGIDPDSFDSRYFGPVSRDAVAVRAVLIWSLR